MLYSDIPRKLILQFSFLALFALVCRGNDVETSSNSKEWFKIEGKVQAPDAWAKSNPDWKLHTYILVDGGEYRGFLRYFSFL